MLVQDKKLTLGQFFRQYLTESSDRHIVFFEVKQWIWKHSFFYVTLLYKSFLCVYFDVLKQDGVNFGLLFFVVYIGKHPGCTPSSLTKDLGMDCGATVREVYRPL